MRRAKQAVVGSAVGLAMLATPLTLPNLGDSAGSAEAAEVGGDGGYDNWAFRGWFERTGDDEKTVNFHRP